MHHNLFESDPKSEYADQRGQSRTKAVVAQPSKLKKRSPLQSVREIDAALEAKYGAPRYREL